MLPCDTGDAEDGEVTYRPLPSDRKERGFFKVWSAIGKVIKRDMQYNG